MISNALERTRIESSNLPTKNPRKRKKKLNKTTTTITTNKSIKLNNNLNIETQLKNKIPEYKPKKEELKEEHKNISQRQFNRLPREIYIPKCSLCHTQMQVTRGDQCYNDVDSINCDNCGREDIHGEVWHCPKGFVNAKTHPGYDLCKTCGYLLPRGQRQMIKRVGPPEDDLGLLLTQKQRHRRKTADGYTLYKWEEIKKELKIGLGGTTPSCPFDCECCF